MSAPQVMLAAPAEAMPFLGRQSELARLEDAIRKRASLLIWEHPIPGRARWWRELLQTCRKK